MVKTTAIRGRRCDTDCDHSSKGRGGPTERKGEALLITSGGFRRGGDTRDANISLSAKNSFIIMYFLANILEKRLPHPPQELAPRLWDFLDPPLITTGLLFVYYALNDLNI